MGSTKNSGLIINTDFIRNSQIAFDCPISCSQKTFFFHTEFQGIILFSSLAKILTMRGTTFCEENLCDSYLLKIVGIIGSVYISSESDGASIAVCNVTVTPLLMLIAG